MQLLSRVLRLCTFLALALCGCRNSVRMAHMVVEADEIGRNVKALDQMAADEFKAHSAAE
jgi:hypothetical protein